MTESGNQTAGQVKVLDARVLVGGQMVHLHTIERGYRFVPHPPADAADALLDVKLRPTILHDVPAGFAAVGFISAGASPAGIGIDGLEERRR